MAQSCRWVSVAVEVRHGVLTVVLLSELWSVELSASRLCRYADWLALSAKDACVRYGLATTAILGTAVIVQAPRSNPRSYAGASFALIVCCSSWFVLFPSLLRRRLAVPPSALLSALSLSAFSVGHVCRAEVPAGAQGALGAHGRGRRVAHATCDGPAQARPAPAAAGGGIGRDRTGDACARRPHAPPPSPQESARARARARPFLLP
eukprot:4029215-Pleurochrysis_carterae.AAC.9